MKQKTKHAGILLSLLFIFSLVAYAMPQVGFYAGPDRLPIGLELTEFQVQCPTPTPMTGERVIVSFRLQNVSGGEITLHPTYGVFIGARCNTTNKDFGHTNKGVTVLPGHFADLSAERILDEAGTWSFWPAFNVNNSWGPFKWHAIALPVTPRIKKKTN